MKEIWDIITDDKEFLKFHANFLERATLKKEARKRRDKRLLENKYRIKF